MLSNEQRHLVQLQQWISKHGGSLGYTRDTYLVQYPQWGTTLKAKLRRNTSDTAVFAQVVVVGEYHPLITWLKHSKDFEPLVIVDAGANIGLTSLQFLAAFPHARVLSVEADAGNAVQLEQNLGLSFELRWQVLRRALWSSDAPLDLSMSFRDALEWSRSVQEASASQGSVQGITPSGLLELAGGSIDVLKIDIEGAEARFFAPEAQPEELLRNTYFIAMELHEEVNFTEAMEQLLRTHGFTFFYVGESIIAANKRRLAGSIS